MPAWPSSDEGLRRLTDRWAFIVSAFDRLLKLGAADQLHAIDIHRESVTPAAESLAALGGTASPEVATFFDFRTPKRLDAVIGNPPYMR